MLLVSDLTFLAIGFAVSRHDRWRDRAFNLWLSRKSLRPRVKRSRMERLMDGQEGKGHVIDLEID